MPSNNVNTTTSSPGENVDLRKLKSRYDALLPKYGFLWRSMANKQLKQSQVDNAKPNEAKQRITAKEKVSIEKENSNPSSSFLDAIQSKQPVILNNHNNCGDDCNDCPEPIIEIDENDSTFDEQELVDSEDDEDVRVGNKGGREAAARVEIDLLDVELGEDSDEEILLTGRNNKRTFVIESDDESERDLVSFGGESEDSEFADTVENEDHSETNLTLHNTNVNNEQNQSGDASTVCEKEWVELPSSNDEEEAKLPPTNTVVILSSDEEDESESGNENDAQSVFSIGSSDSDEIIYVDMVDRRVVDKQPTNVKTGNDSNKDTKSKRKKPLRSDKNASRTKETPTASTSNLSSKSSSLAFRKQRDSILASTFATFNQLAFNGELSSVEVSWSNRLNTTAGITRMKGRLGQPNSRVATIELATKVIDSEEKLRSTLLHELCHAAAWLVDGAHKPPHGKCFKKWAAISMKKIKDVEVTTTHDYQIAYKYAWACTSNTCSVVIKRHSRSIDPTKHCCGRCKSKLIEIEVPGNSGTSVRYTPKQRKTSQYALFVKEQTSHTRIRLAKERNCKSSEVSQAEVMKECGRLWRAPKAKCNNDSELGMVADKLSGMAISAGSL